ncbi:MAG: TetR/AcrR family transcriptional regulator [Chloroflexota bacterium]
MPDEETSVDAASARSQRQIAARQRQVAARLEQILDAASRLFAEKGFHRTTTKEIAEAAGLSEGTLYNYFESKNDLLFGIMARLARKQNLTAQLSADVPGDTRQLFLEVFKSQGLDPSQTAMQQALLSEILADADLRQRYYQELVLPALEMLERQLQARIQLGHIQSVDAQLAARLVVSIWTGLFVLQVLDDPLVHSRWEDLANTTAAILFEGIHLP